MNPSKAITAAVALGLLALTARAAPAAPVPHYAVLAPVPGPPIPGWDYASVDVKGRKLYLGAKSSVILDLDTGTIATPWAAGTMIHSVVPLRAGMLALDDGMDHQVRFVDAATGKVQATVDTGGSSNPHGFHNPDAMILDPRSGLLVVGNGDSGDVVLVDPKQHTLAATIPIGTELEFIAADGHGNAYVNLAAKGGIARINIAKRAVTATMMMKGCEEPSGLAYDAPHDLLMSVCGNGLLKVVKASTMTEVASVEVAKGADAVIFDPMRHTVFIAGAEDGKLSVIHADGAKDIAVVQTIDTARGVRLGAVDPKTGKVYLPVIDYDPKAKPVSMAPGFPPRPPAIDSSFRFMVIGPQ